MKQAYAIFLIAVLGSTGVFAADPPTSDATIAEARLRQQVEELTVLLRELRLTSQNQTSKIAALDSDRDINTSAMSMLRELNPRIAQSLIEVAQIEARIDRFEDVTKLRNSNDGSPEALENIRRVRHAHLSADVTWVRGKEFLKNALSQPQTGQNAK